MPRVTALPSPPPTAGVWDENASVLPRCRVQFLAHTPIPAYDEYGLSINKHRADSSSPVHGRRPPTPRTYHSFPSEDATAASVSPRQTPESGREEEEASRAHVLASWHTVRLAGYFPEGREEGKGTGLEPHLGARLPRTPVPRYDKHGLSSTAVPRGLLHDDGCACPVHVRVYL